MKNKLNLYNKKRNFNKTKEPKAKIEKGGKKLRFVVQHHIARKDHYDLRLEYNGVMKSWAVPKGPSYNIKDKRLAVEVEDHPLSYRNFEGNIPEGQYGAGSVMIWDNGYYQLLEFKKDVIKFVLNGKRLKGMWSLVRFKDNNWLLIKESDGVSLFKDIDEFDTSVRTGKTMEEIKNGFKIEITSPDKVIFEKPKITKKDIVDYYNEVSKRMLPFLDKRLISVIRSPNGFKGDKFFKKHLENNNKGLGKYEIDTKNNKKEDYYYIKNLEGLISEVQMNSYEFHIWGSKITNIDKPDIIVFDLDPDLNLSMKKLREGVKDLKNILDELKLKSYLKTSGGKGYHVVVPVKGNKYTWNDVKEISKTVAKLMETKWPDKYVSNVRKENRKNKIFIDYIRNTKSATSVAPYSLRLKDKPAISMPIEWSELDSVRPNSISIKDALKRIKEKDPWIDFFN